jgi:hypothetical protein
MAQETKVSSEDATLNASQPADAYRGLAYGKSELVAAMRENYDELIAFVTEPAFQAVYKELMALPATERPTFVNRVLLRPDELEKRGVRVSPGILIQTSAFGDRRPTLFAVKKFLPAKFHDSWENVNLTFDNEYNDEDVSRDPAITWRRPLPVALQNAVIGANLDLESVPDIGANDPSWSYQLGKTMAIRGE